MANVNEGKLHANAPVVYFIREGRQNLDQVLKVVRNVLKKREDLRRCKVVIFTAQGEGPYKAYTVLGEYSPKIIAVTFPRTFTLERDGKHVSPQIPPRIRKFFDGVGIEVVIPPSLPFDLIGSMEGHNQEARLVRDVLSIFGGGFSLCIQAVLRACDAGNIELGESVIALSGNVAALITASTTNHFLDEEWGVAVEEVFCKPRKLSVVRPTGSTGLIEADTSEHARP